jgi:hypothetical protein
MNHLTTGKAMTYQEECVCIALIKRNGATLKQLHAAIAAADGEIERALMCLRERGDVTKMCDEYWIDEAHIRAWWREN